MYVGNALQTHKHAANTHNKTKYTNVPKIHTTQPKIETRCKFLQQDKTSSRGH